MIRQGNSRLRPLNWLVGSRRTKTSRTRWNSSRPVERPYFDSEGSNTRIAEEIAEAVSNAPGHACELKKRASCPLHSSSTTFRTSPCLPVSSMWRRKSTSSLSPDFTILIAAIPRWIRTWFRSFRERSASLPSLTQRAILSLCPCLSSEAMLHFTK